MGLSNHDILTKSRITPYLHHHQATSPQSAHRLHAVLQTRMAARCLTQQCAAALMATPPRHYCLEEVGQAPVRSAKCSHPQQRLCAPKVDDASLSRVEPIHDALGNAAGYDVFHARAVSVTQSA